MESGIYLSAMVFGVGLMHLVVRAASMMSNGKRTGQQKTKSNAQRDDWYMFFHRSQLTGTDERDTLPPQTGVRTKPVARKPRAGQRRAQMRI